MPPEHPRQAAPQRAEDPEPAEPPGPRRREYAPILDVVAVHVIADHVSPDSPAAVLLLRSLLAVAVPAFVMMSGALNLDPAAMRHGTGAFLGRRLRRLVPATIVWTAVYVLASVLIAPAPLTGEDIVRGLLEASTFPHLSPRRWSTISRGPRAGPGAWAPSPRRGRARSSRSGRSPRG